MTETLLNLPQVAQMLGVSERTVHRLMELGELHPFKMGKAWKFEQSDLDAYFTRLREATIKKSKEKAAKRQKEREVA